MENMEKIGKRCEKQGKVGKMWKILGELVKIPRTCAGENREKFGKLGKTKIGGMQTQAPECSIV